MTVAKNTVVAIAYRAKNSEGAVVDSAGEDAPFEYLHGYGNVIPGLEKALEGRRASDAFEAAFEPADGYGEYDEALVLDIPRGDFPRGAEIAAGEKFAAESGAGCVTVTVTRVNGDVVTVDANHPLSGERLFFSGRVVSVRNAAPEEIARGDLESGCECGGCGNDCDSCGCGG
jgi:FKBP-type peptidyl-prolyl cis-trans isomerase SlyD